LPDELSFVDAAVFEFAVLALLFDTFASISPS